MKLNRLRAAMTGGDHEFNDVRAFQEKFGQLSFYEPGLLTKRKLAERIRFLQEELNELTSAHTLALQADALVDLVYVAKGTAVMMGLPWTELWDDVQRANMAKVRGITHRGNLADVRKPMGWDPPHTTDILREAGWWYGDMALSNFEDGLQRDDAEYKKQP